MRPTRSTTKMRPEPSLATDTPTGSLKPSATLISETFCAPGIVPPGRATSAGVEGIVWATAATELNTVAAATAASHRAFIACTSPADRRQASPSRHAPGREAMMGPRSASILSRSDRTWKAGSRDCDDLRAARPAKDMIENELLHRGGRDRAVRQERRSRADHERTFFGTVGRAAVRTLHQARVEGDHVHQGAQAETPFGEAGAERELRKADRRIEEELDRVVAGLAVDLDRAREVGSAGFVKPVIIAEPGVRACERDELARARVVEAPRAFARIVQHVLDAV